MNPILRLSLIAGLLLSFGAAALLLQAWAGLPLQNGTQFPAGTPPEVRLAELSHREQVATFTLSLLALAAITGAAILPRAQTRAATETSSRQELELLARAAATSSEELARERNVRQRTEENLAMEQLRAGQAQADKIRLGRDLHDGMVQSLYATGLTLTTARQKLTSEPERAAELLDRSIELLNSTLRDLRTAIAGLSAIRQQGQSFPAAVRLVLEMLGSGREAAFDVRLDETAAARIGETNYADLLQIVREAVSNALRHAAAKTITVRLHEDQGRLCLLIQDDGRGFAPAQIPSGRHGLGNLRARAELLRGELSVTSQPRNGTRVVLTFPASPAA